LRLTELYIRNLKAASDVRLELSPLTALVGPNGSGKSTILYALDHFFNGTKPEPGDFKKGRTEMFISVTFEGVQGESRSITIERRWSLEQDKVSMEEVDTEGLTEAAKKRILKSVNAVFVPAEHETDNDGTDKSRLQLSKFLKGVVGNEAYKAGIAAEVEKVNDHYLRLREHTSKFEEELNKRLCGYANDPTGYAPDSKVRFTVKAPELEPVVETEFVENKEGYDHRSAGHGTKRAYHMAALETYAEVSKGDSDRLLLVIVDEPEIHQHPQRQKRILETLQRLTKDGSCQVVYSTHSPAFVDLRKPLGLYRITRDDRLNIIPHPARDVDPVLHQFRLSKHIADGVFSHGVILVEGPHDVAILTAILSIARGKDKSVLKELVGADVNFVVCDGIGNVPHFVRFFQALGMPIFAVWDADGHGSDTDLTREIFGLLGRSVKFSAGQRHDCCHAGEDYLCFSHNMCLYFKDRLGFRDYTPNKDTTDKIKGSIASYEGLVPGLRDSGIGNSDFVTNVVSRIRDRFFGR